MNRFSGGGVTDLIQITRLQRVPQPPDAGGWRLFSEAVHSAGTAAAAAAKAQAALAKSTVSVTKAVKNAMLAFDELHVAGQDKTTEQAASRGKSAAKSSSKGAARRAAADAKQTQTVWERCRDAVLDIFALLRARLQSLSALFAPGIRAWGEAFDALRGPAGTALEQMRGQLQRLWDGTLSPLGRYVLTEFAPGVANAFSQTAAPALSAFGKLACGVLADGFSAACEAAQGVIHTLLLPALETLRTAFGDVCAGLSEIWDEYGASMERGFSALMEDIGGLWDALYEDIILPVCEELSEALAGLWEGLREAWETHGGALLEGISGFLQSIGGMWDTLYNETLLPGLSALGGMIDGLWQEHLAPLWESLTQLAAELGVLLLTVWNEYLSPLLQQLTEIFAPAAAAVFSGAAGAARGLLETVCGVARGISQALRGVVEFLSGVFAGDWSRAWQGILMIVDGVWQGITGLIRGAVNLIIGCINLMIQAVYAVFNGIAGALNRLQISIPSWVPFFGGQRFSVNLPTFTAPQIPYLAKGAVIPPNAAFLAVLGDQKAGRNLEAPEGLLRQIVREESKGAARFEAEQPIELSLDGEVFYRAMERIRAGRGARIGGAFAEAY